MKTRLVLSSLLLLATGAAYAAENPWVGTWKLDPAQSHLAGDTFTYSKGPGSLLHFSDGVVAYDFGTDGKAYKSAYDRTTTWTQTGPNSWDSVTTRNGKVLGKAQRTLSADGKTLTVHYTGTRPDGAPFDDRDVYTRMTAGAGLLGTWKSLKVGTTGGNASLPSGAVPPAQQTVYAAEVFYKYQPITPIGKLVAWTLPTQLYDVAYY